MAPQLGHKVMLMGGTIGTGACLRQISGSLRPMATALLSRGVPDIEKILVGGGDYIPTEFAGRAI